MEPFKGKKLSFFYHKFRTHSPQNSIEISGTMSKKGGEEGGPAHVAVTARQQWRMRSMCCRIFYVSVPVSSVVFWRRSYPPSHIFIVERFDLVRLIFWDLCKFFYSVYVGALITVMVSPSTNVLSQLESGFSTAFNLYCVVWIYFGTRM